MEMILTIFIKDAINMRIKITNPTPDGIRDLLTELCEQYSVELSTLNLYVSFNDKKYNYDFFNVETEEQAFISLTGCSLESNGLTFDSEGFNFPFDGRCEFTERGLISVPKASKKKTPK